VTREPLWDVKQTAAFLNMSLWWIYTSAQQGTLPSIKVGRSLKFDPTAIRAWLDERARGPGRQAEAAATASAKG